MTPAAKAMPEGHKQTHEWIAVAHLTVDHYQRSVNKQRVAKIMREFDPDLVGTLIVSRRDDGTNYLIDGQQRREAVERMWGGTQRVPCDVFHGLSYEREAELFVEYNVKRTKPRPLDIFKGRVDAKNADALAITAILRRHGLVAGSANSPTNVSCIGTVQDIFHGGGPHVLDTTLDVVLRAGIYRDEPIHGVFLEGVAILLSRYPSLDQQRVKIMLQEAIPRRLLATARSFRADVASHERRLAPVVARLLLQAYNRGRRTNRVEWVDDVPLNSWKPVDGTTSE